jgi:flagellar motor switch protein FliG
MDAVAEGSSTQAVPATNPNAVDAVDQPDVDDLTGAQKSAVLLIALGLDAASAVLKQLDDSEVEKVSVEIARMRNISSEVVEAVLVEYRDLAMAQDYIAQGGVGFAKQALEEALGSRRAEDIIMKVEAAMEVSAFHLLQTVETDQLTNFLRNEHPQTAALILSHLNPIKGSDIIKHLDPDLQSEILYRLATMGKTSPEMLGDIENVIREQLGSVFGAQLSVSGGIEQVAEILNGTSRTTERAILDSIRDRSTELADNIKQLMFVFEDLMTIHDRDMQRLLTEVEQDDLAVSLKASSEQLKQKIFDNVSQRVADGIKEELELMGPVRVSDVEEAQRKILDTAQRLEEEDEIALTRSTQDMIE